MMTQLIYHYNTPTVNYSHTRQEAKKAKQTFSTKPTPVQGKLFGGGGWFWEL